MWLVSSCQWQPVCPRGPGDVATDQQVVYGPSSCRCTTTCTTTCTTCRHSLVTTGPSGGSLSPSLVPTSDQSLRSGSFSYLHRFLVSEVPKIPLNQSGFHVSVGSFKISKPGDLKRATIKDRLMLLAYLDLYISILTLFCNDSMSLINVSLRKETENYFKYHIG